MCGIAGGVSFNQDYFPSLDQIKNFSACLKFRGPDAEGFQHFQSGNALVNLAHKRLKIIDLSDEGNQPMQSGTGKSSIVFNGEIYNYQSLKQELIKLGGKFRTSSDTEVLLVGYEIWGLKKLLECIDGMFAFAIFDHSTEELHLARDRFGKKPLYYFHSGEKIAFSSDIRSFDSLNISKSLDHHSLGFLFYELSTPRSSSIWSEIKKLPEAHCATFSANGFEISRYWQLDFNESCTLSNSEIISRVNELLNDATKKRMVADVNVAAQLSGGVDSSLVVAMMAQNSSKPIHTYTVGFENEKFNELPYAKAVAEKYNTDHHELIIQPNDLSIIDTLIDEYGEPFADSSMIPSYLVAKEISKQEKVVCGGDGGDELFAGYYEHYFIKKLEQFRKYKFLSAPARALSKVFPSYRTNFLADVLSKAHRPDYMQVKREMGFQFQDFDAIIPENTHIKGSINNELQSVWSTYSNPKNSLFTNGISASLHVRLVNDYLVKVDRASMFASLEMRSPFLDKNLAEFAATLTPQQLYMSAGTKSILKKLAEKHLPMEVIYRQKMGFGIPLVDWFRNELDGHLRDVILGGKQTLIKMNYHEIEKLINRHQEGEDHTGKLWSLYVFHKWAQKYS